MSAIITHTATLVIVDCCSCGMPIGLQSRWVANAKAVGNKKHTFWCPYCNTKQGWGTSQHEKEIAALKEECDKATRNAAYQAERKNYFRQESEHFRKSRDGMKGQLVRTKKRIASGVCPCCNRTFQNLRNHMANKHPNFAEKS